jgi:hypothetical protein
MGVGSINHGWHITSWDVYDLTNYNKYCIIYSLGCHANRMDVDDAISEFFVFATDSTGAVAFTGNTRSGWFYVGDPMSLSSELDFYWWVGLFEYNQYRLGEALAFAKSATDINTVHPYSDWTLNLLGEPEMPIWKAGSFPSYLTAIHTTELEALPNVYDVHIEATGGADVENAFVCLWKGDEIYQRGYTDAAGDISFDIYPTTLGTMYVTVTKQNHIPYLGQATVAGNVPPVCITPADTSFFQCSAEEVALPVGCFDDDGNLASGPQLAKGPGQIIGGYWYYTPVDDDSVEVTIHCEDSLGFFCETTFIVLFDINDAPICFIPGDSLISQIAPPVEIVLPVAADDANGNVGECIILSGPGEITNGNWCYTPVNDEIIDVVLQFTDDCNASCQDGFQVTYEVMACGDPNADLIVNIFDITYLINFLYKDGAAPQPVEAGDADGSGAINLFDATYLITHLYKSGPAPICP